MIHNNNAAYRFLCKSPCSKLLAAYHFKYSRITLKTPSIIASDDDFICFLLSFAEDSYEISSLIFSEKKQKKKKQ